MTNKELFNLPFVSVIIPVYNDPAGLRNTLKSAVEQKYPSEMFEIIIVDNGSTDDTFKVANEFAEKYPQLIKVTVENTIQTSYAARNKGIRASKGSIIVFVDADMTINVNWLQDIINEIEKYKADYLACNVEVHSSNDSIYGLYDKITGFPVERYVNNDHFAPTCCLVVSKALIDKIGLFDSTLLSGGDFEFGNRVYRAGFNMQYSPDIIMKHPARTSIRQLYYKAFRVGRGLRQISCYHSEYFKNNKSINRNILNPVYYLPVPPWSFNKSLKGNYAWDTASVKDKITIYLIYCFIERLGKQIGYIYEKLKSR